MWYNQNLGFFKISPNVILQNVFLICLFVYEFIWKRTIKNNNVIFTQVNLNRCAGVRGLGNERCDFISKVSGYAIRKYCLKLKYRYFANNNCNNILYFIR